MCIDEYTECNTLPPIALTVKEAAGLLRISTEILYRLTNRQDFPAFKIGNRILIPYEGLKAWAMDQIGETLESKPMKKCSIAHRGAWSREKPRQEINRHEKTYRPLSALYGGDCN